MNKQPIPKALKSSGPGVRRQRRAAPVAAPAAVAVETRQEEVARKLGARMRDLRLERRMSLAQMQKCGGLTPSQMSSVERGHVQMTLGTVVSVARALQMPTFMVLLLPDEDPLAAVIEEIRQAYGGDWSRAAFVIAGALGLDLSKLMRKR
jgi:transcriptional regulator with XRE-family HTH domain